MKFQAVIFIVTILLVLLIHPFLDKVYRKVCISMLLKKRKCLTDQEILFFYIKNNFSEEIVLRLWYEVANILEVPAGYLRPDDKLHKIVTLFFFTDDRIEEISEMALEHADALGISAERVEKIYTLDDYIKAFG